MDVYKQNIITEISCSPKAFLYQHLIDNFCLQFYLRKPIDPVYKSYITCFRTSSHNLNVEVGRHNNIVREQRLCTMCNLHDIEDEFQFILKCPLYGDEKKIY